MIFINGHLSGSKVGTLGTRLERTCGSGNPSNFKGVGQVSIPLGSPTHTEIWLAEIDRKNRRTQETKHHLESTSDQS